MGAFDNASEFAGALSFMLLLAALALWFGRKGLRAEARSLRYSNLSICMGLLVFLAPHMLLKLEPGVLSAVLVSSGAAKLALALAGIVFAVRALTWRRRDSATGLARPLAGMAFSFLHALVAISMCLMPLAMSGGTGTHRVAFPEHGFAMELPGDS